MTPVEISALVTAIGGIISVLASYFISKDNARKEAEKNKAIVEDGFRDDLLARIKQQNDFIIVLNGRIDALQIERVNLYDKYETKVAEIRVEMRKVIEASAVEVAHWRDNYNKLVDDYQKLRLEHYSLKRDHEDIKDELERLRRTYETVLTNYERLKDAHNKLTSNDNTDI